MDFVQPSGSYDITSSASVPAIGGYRYALNAIDHGSGRVFTYLTKGTNGPLTYLLRIYNINQAKGYQLQHLHIDKAFATVDLRNFYDEKGIQLHVGVPYEHQSLGSIERFNRTVKETRLN